MERQKCMVHILQQRKLKLKYNKIKFLQKHDSVFIKNQNTQKPSEML